MCTLTNANRISINIDIPLSLYLELQIILLFCDFFCFSSEYFYIFSSFLSTSSSLNFSYAAVASAFSIIQISRNNEKEIFADSCIKFPLRTYVHSTHNYGTSMAIEWRHLSLSLSFDGYEWQATLHSIPKKNMHIYTDFIFIIIISLFPIIAK